MVKEIKRSSVRTWSKLGQRGTFFAMALPELGNEFENLWLLTADLALLSSMERFSRAHPDRFINVGIAEQDMIGIAYGLALDDHCVFASTYASFAAVRDLEQVRQLVSYQKTNVKIVASAAGLAAAKTGVSHWATEDLTFMRALPNMTILSAADSVQAYRFAEYAAATPGPMYIRLSGGLNCPIVYDENYEFEAGKIDILREGSDVAIIATGLMVYESLNAAEILGQQGVSCTVANVHTLKPLDMIALDNLFRSHELIVTVEEHSVIGGLGGLIAERKAMLAKAPRQVFIGIESFDAKPGSQQYVWEQVGLTAEMIAQKIESETAAR